MIQLLAYAIVAVHFAVIMIDCGGAFMVITNRFPRGDRVGWQSVYAAVVLGKALAFILLDHCPLTAAENLVRSWANPASAYETSFVAHYLPWLPQRLDLLITCLLMLAGCVFALRLVHSAKAGMDVEPIRNCEPTAPDENGRRELRTSNTSSKMRVQRRKPAAGGGLD